MIYINKNSENKIALSLSDNVTITGSSVYFLFDFNNIQTRNEVIFTGQDLSTNPYRYNLFNIIETGSSFVNLTASTVSLDEGYWDYKVYQMTGQTNLELSGVTGGPIQYGIVFVSGTTANNGTQFEYTGETETRYVYNG